MRLSSPVVSTQPLILTSPAAESNVFQVPDETSVEGSEAEDTLERARRFIHVHGNRSIYNVIDLTQEAILPLNLTAGVDIPVAGEREDEDPELPALSGSEDDDAAEVYADYDGDYSRDYVEDDGDSEDYAEGEDEDDLKDEDDVADGAAFNLSDDGIEEEEYGSSEPSCTCAIGDIEPSASGALVDESTNLDEVEAPLTGEEASANVEIDTKDDGDLSQPGDEIPSLVVSEEFAANESVIHFTPEINSPKKPISTGEDSTVSRKRKASEISMDEEPSAPSNKDKPAPIVNVLPASGVQTDPSEEREPKRLRRTVDIVGYTALGGLAGALAVFTTLVMSAPSFS